MIFNFKVVLAFLFIGVSVGLTDNFFESFLKRDAKCSKKQFREGVYMMDKTCFNYSGIMKKTLSAVDLLNYIENECSSIEATARCVTNVFADCSFALDMEMSVRRELAFCNDPIYAWIKHYATLHPVEVPATCVLKKAFGVLKKCIWPDLMSGKYESAMDKKDYEGALKFLSRTVSASFKCLLSKPDEAWPEDQDCNASTEEKIFMYTLIFIIGPEFPPGAYISVNDLKIVQELIDPTYSILMSL